MKVALISDTHWGARGNSSAFEELMRYYWKEVFFPYLKAHGIKVIIHGGDFVDVKTNINYKVHRSMKESFFDMLEKEGVMMYVIPGNHDIFFRHDNEINAIKELFPNHPNVKLIESVEDVHIGGTTFCLVPWLSKNNAEQFLLKMAESTADYCVGHFEVAGAKMYANSVSEKGLDSGIFKHFKKVYSGHYHHPGLTDNIQYIGSTFHLTWQCYGDKRGFFVLDTDTGDDEYVENDYCLFQRIYYDDSVEFEVPDADVLKRELEGSILELIVLNKSDNKKYLSLKKRLDTLDLISFGVVERYLLTNISPDDTSKIIQDAAKKGTVEVLMGYVEEYSKADKTTLANTVRQIYDEAVDMMAVGE